MLSDVLTFLSIGPYAFRHTHHTSQKKKKANVKKGPIQGKKVDCFVLFLSYEIHQTLDASDCVLGVFGKLSTRRGAWAWFHDV